MVARRRHPGEEDVFVFVEAAIMVSKSNVLSFDGALLERN